MGVSLYANDSVNLTTGEVTRSEFATTYAEFNSSDYKARLMANAVKDVRRNNLDALAYVLRHSA